MRHQLCTLIIILPTSQLLCMALLLKFKLVSNHCTWYSQIRKTRFLDHLASELLYSNISSYRNPLRLAWNVKHIHIYIYIKSSHTSFHACGWGFFFPHYLNLLRLWELTWQCLKAAHVSQSVYLERQLWNLIWIQQILYAMWIDA